MGGDGTVNAVAAALAGTPTPLLVLPAGTLNHFAQRSRRAARPRRGGAARARRAAARGRRRRGQRARVHQQLVDRRLSARRRAARAPAGRERQRQVDGHDAGGAAHVPPLSDRAACASRATTARVPLETPFVFVGNNVYGGEGVEASAARAARRGLPRRASRSRHDAPRGGCASPSWRRSAAWTRRAHAVWRGEPTRADGRDGRPPRCSSPSTARS